MFFGRFLSMSVFLFGVCLVLFLGGQVCAANDDTITIAFVPRSLNNTVFLEAFEEAQRKAVELGVRLEWVAPFSFDTEEQVAIIEGLIRRRVDGIVVSGNDVPSIRNVIKRAQEAGIAVATFDADIPNSGRLFHVGINNYKVGFTLGEVLKEIISRRQISGILKVAIMTGVREAHNLEERVEGFLDATQGESQLHIETILENNDSFEQAVSILEEYIDSNPDVGVIVFVGGWAFHVPSRAIPNFKNWAEQGGIAVGLGVFYNALVLQQEGLIQYLLGQDSGSMGSLALENLVSYIRTGDAPHDFIEVGFTHAHSGNVGNLLEVYGPVVTR